MTEEFVRTEPRSKLREKLHGDRTEGDAGEPTSTRSTPRSTTSSAGPSVAEAEDARELAEWAKAELGLTLDAAKLTGHDRATRPATRLLNAYDEKYRPEMHSVERSLVLEQLDSAWKSHLLMMDSLRSGVGLRGYAQEDPKIVYKREGMKEFDDDVGGRPRPRDGGRIPHGGDGRRGSAGGAVGRCAGDARGRDLGPPGRARRKTPTPQMQTNTGGEAKKAEPIRNIGAKVGRNDPCPCGSGKKYKNCHMKLEAGKK